MFFRTREVGFFRGVGSGEIVLDFLRLLMISVVLFIGIIAMCISAAIEAWRR